MKSAAIVIVLLIASPCFGYEILFHATDPANNGTVAAMHGTAEQTVDAASVPQRWKSVRAQASASGTATHFLIRIATSSANSLPVGFAVYASTGSGGSNPPGNTPLALGYLPSYTFTATGWYAFPFTDDATMEVTSGTYYHLTYMINEDDLYADPDGSRIGSPAADKWFPDCQGTGCEYDEPPGVGSEPTYADENNYATSASWQQGLLITEEEAPPISGCTITGGTR